jgi:hypothetical protein
MAAIAAAGLISSCAPRVGKIATGDVIDRNSLPLSGFRGDATYAVVRKDAIPALYDNFISVLSKQGLVKWDERYDCNHFASLFIALSQTQYAVAAWHSESKAQTLAMSEFWYFSPRGGHAIVAIVTDHGLMFFEPQTGKEVQLTEFERKSAYMCKW